MRDSIARKREREKERDNGKTYKGGNAMDIDIKIYLAFCLMTGKSVGYYCIHTRRKQQTDGFFEPMNNNCSLFPFVRKCIIPFKIIHISH